MPKSKEPRSTQEEVDSVLKDSVPALGTGDDNVEGAKMPTGRFLLRLAAEIVDRLP